jgi:N-acetylmuramoyl-L-alanine amidase
LRLIASLLVVLLVTVAVAARPASQGSASAYAVYTSEGRRSLPFRSSGGQDLITLEQLAPLFGLTFSEDALVGGLTVRGAGEPILLIPGQSFASIGPGRIVSLPAPVQRDRTSWIVPVEFVRQALGPAMGQPVEIRRASHVILVGDVHLPQISGTFSRQGENARLALEIEPPAPSTVTREGSRLLIRFEAVALAFTPISGLAQEFVTSVRAEGTTIAVTLGQGTAGYRLAESEPGRLGIELLAPGPPPPSAARPAEPAAPPPLSIAAPGGIRTVVIDPGHGGADNGVVGSGGAKEKDLVLQLARRLKGAIEGQMGVRVLLTREGDEDVPVDRRASLANNNKADLFISLHANASLDPAVQGAQVMSLRLEDYRARVPTNERSEIPVPVVGGGTRVIDVVPWDVAQIPFAQRSAGIAQTLLRHLKTAGVPLFARPAAQLPLRPLVGANMPAIMVEVGFLSNPAEEKALIDAARSQKLLDALFATVAEVRRGSAGAAASSASAPPTSPLPSPALSLSPGAPAPPAAAGARAR